MIGSANLSDVEGRAEFPKEYRRLGRHLIWRGDLVIYAGGGMGSANGLGLPPGTAEFVGLGGSVLSYLLPVPASRRLRLSLYALFAIVAIGLMIRFGFRVSWPLALLLMILIRLGHEGLLGPTRFGRFLRRPLGRRGVPTS